VPELDETSPSAVTIRANLHPVITVPMKRIKSVLVMNTLMGLLPFYVHSDYALPLDRDKRFAAAKPAMADMNSHAAAGRGTGEML
jgi:hypothetical protein